MRNLVTLIGISLLPYLATAQIDKKVLFIGIDGCRPDAITIANTPNLDGLISNGTYSMDAMNGGITSSGPGWSNLLCGVRDDKHGVTSNTFFGANYTDYPHFFNRVEEYDASIVTASFTTWWPLELIILDMVDVKYGLEYSLNGDQIVSDSLEGYLGSGNPDVTFMYFGDVDDAGHTHGFSPNVPEYISALEATDAHIGKLLTAINNRPTIANENWLYIVSTDHGGVGLGHGGTSFVEENIFMIVSGDTVPNMEIIRDTVFDVDSGFYVDDFSNTPRQVDVMPTILEFLCIPVQPSWGLEGTSLITPCQVVSVDKKTSNDILELTVFPNPSNGSFHIVSPNSRNGRISVADAMGRLIPFEATAVSDGYILVIPNAEQGVYTISLISDNSPQLRNIMIIQ